MWGLGDILFGSSLICAGNRDPAKHVDGGYFALKLSITMNSATPKRDAPAAVLMSKCNYSARSLSV